MNQQIKKWYEEHTQITTQDSDWSYEGVELGKNEIDVNLLPKEEIDVEFETILVEFYSINDDVVYVMASLTKKGYYLYGLLRKNELIQTDYRDINR